MCRPKACVLLTDAPTTTNFFQLAGMKKRSKFLTLIISVLSFFVLVVTPVPGMSPVFVHAQTTSSIQSQIDSITQTLSSLQSQVNSYLQSLFQSAGVASQAQVAGSALISGLSATFAQGALTAGNTFYTDRAYTLSTAPSNLNGDLLIETPNNDKFNTSSSYLTFTVNQASTIYVAFDKNITVTLGGNGAAPSSANSSSSNYFVVVASGASVSSGSTTTGTPSAGTYLNGAPYPYSTLITGISFNSASLQTAAPGSDEWPYTEGSDGNLYVSWGDGGGFGGSNSSGRVGLGFGRITGTPPSSWSGVNISGGVSPSSGFVVSGGSGGTSNMFSVGSTLYTFSALNQVWGTDYLFKSTDSGQTWQNLGAFFTPSNSNNFRADGTVQYGSGGSGAPDSYIYTYSAYPFTNGLALTRVLQSQVENPSAYQFFAGFDTSGNPTWGAASQMQSVFNDPNGTEWGTSVSYDPYLNRYLLAIRHNGNTGEVGLFSGLHPWGPWKTIAYGNGIPSWVWSPDPSGASANRPSWEYGFPQNWMSTDNLQSSATYTLSCTGTGGSTSQSTSVSVTAAPVPTNSSLISGLSSTFGQGTLTGGNQFYTDRAYTLTLVPSNLNGDLLIETPNNDKFNTSSSYLTFTVNQASTVYVAFDKNISTPPSWLSAFTDTGTRSRSAETAQPLQAQIPAAQTTLWW
ncbi:MAG: hypothetical protein B7X04_04150 [Parcubacteria group bacterium 21-54-25]|nr:MAG: hypothetical protein B7X04_04150 [Parcubacteria group bacterium 21-54-25]